MLAEDQIFDGHNDALTRWSSRNDDVQWTFVESAGRGHLDLPRARAGGFVGGFFAIGAWLETDWQPRGRDFHKTEEGYFVDLAPAVEFEASYRYCNEIFGRLERTLEESNGAVVLARNANDIDLASSDTLVVIAHFEGAEAIAEDLSNLDAWYARGLRSIGPVWSRPNAFGTGVPFAYPASPDIGPGLTEAGKELIRACDQQGILIDLAHLNEKGFWDVAELTTHPILVTHTAAHALCPKPRNLKDRQIDAVAESGGVIGITFFSNDLRANRNTEGNASINDIVRHVLYVAERVGVDHVALGSDFDGAPIPADLEDAAGLPRLIDALRAAGFTGDALAKITHGNWMKAARAVLGSF